MTTQDQKNRQRKASSTPTAGRDIREPSGPLAGAESSPRPHQRKKICLTFTPVSKENHFGKRKRNYYSGDADEHDTASNKERAAEDHKATDLSEVHNHASIVVASSYIPVRESLENSERQITAKLKNLGNRIITIEGATTELTQELDRVEKSTKKGGIENIRKFEVMTEAVKDELKATKNEMNVPRDQASGLMERVATRAEPHVQKLAPGSSQQRGWVNPAKVNRLSALETRHQTTSRILSKMEEEDRTTKKELTDLREEIEALKSRLGDHWLTPESDTAASEDALTALQALHDKLQREVQEQLAASEKRNGQAIADGFERLDSRIDKVEKDMLALRCDIEMLRDQYDIHSSRLDFRETTIAHAHQSVNRLSRMTEEHKEALDVGLLEAKQAANKACFERNSEIATEMDAMKAMQTLFEERLKALESHNHQARTPRSQTIHTPPDTPLFQNIPPAHPTAQHPPKVPSASTPPAPILIPSAPRIPAPQPQSRGPAFSYQPIQPQPQQQAQLTQQQQDARNELLQQQNDNLRRIWQNAQTQLAQANHQVAFLQHQQQQQQQQQLEEMHNRQKMQPGGQRGVLLPQDMKIVDLTQGQPRSQPQQNAQRPQAQLTWHPQQQ